MEADLAEAHLLLAQAALLDGDCAAGARAAAAARRLFQRQRRGSWATLARYFELQSVWATGTRSAALGRRARGLAELLERAGWAAPALDARLMAARVALARRDLVAARADLRRSAGARRRGPVDLRARAWHAEALLRLGAGDRPGARRAVASGLRALADHDATLGATELRVHAATRGEELAALGLRLALDDGRPAEVLRWADRHRGRVLRRRPVRPPQDAVVARDLAALRQLGGELEAVAADGGDVSALLRRQVVLEEAVRRRTRQAAGTGSSSRRS